MAATAGILGQIAGQAQANRVANPMDTSTSNASGAGSTSSDSATISANDFLTLLVTEMQNQDPTATTDPNEYINQLVQVNSLEQLIGINQTLTGALGTPSSASNSNGGTTGQAVKGDMLLSSPASQSPAAMEKTAATPTASITASALAHNPVWSPVSGNLGVPPPNPAADRVAQALSTRPSATTATPAMR